MTNVIEDKLTENQEKELEIYTRKENYKKTQKYLLTPVFENICQYFDNKWKRIFADIKKEIDWRIKAEATYSEIDFIVSTIEYYKEILKKLWKEEWAEVFKKELKTRIENAESNVYIKVAPDELFDLPTYTNLDMIKSKRNRYLTVRKYLQGISEWFYDKEIKTPELNPYKEEVK